jgi:sec-independent protein translocase protein TatA
MDILGSMILQFAGVRGLEWVLIILVVVTVFFGAKKLPELARSFGKATTEFEKARIEAKSEIDKIRNSGNSTASLTGNTRKKLEETAGLLGIGAKDKNDDDLKAAIRHELNKK